MKRLGWFLLLLILTIPAVMWLTALWLACCFGVLFGTHTVRWSGSWVHLEHR